ncbi:MAG: 50S ribosomal protein L9 [Alphaproteobacteria bacterium]|nr:50S ribosomal protein L9 [Alphaproteobacteria bacterium]
MPKTIKKRAEAEKLAAKIKGVKAPVIRQASEGGVLFGSVTSRDIADQVAEVTGVAIQRNQVAINQNFKSIGLFPVDIILHPEVKVEVIVNIARSVEEAAKQAESGKALIAATGGVQEEVDNEAALEAALDDTALESHKEREAAEAAEEAEEAEKSKKKSEARASKKAAKAAEEATEEEITTLGDASAAAPASEEDEE